MSFLEKKIKEASQKYYSGQDSGMSDSEFDADLAELRKEDPDNPLLTAVGHGYDVMLDSTPGAKISHIYGTASGLSKAYKWKELDPAFQREYYIGLSLKLDGLSVILYYIDSLLVRALTRGSNNVGIDVTEKVLAIDSSFKYTKDNFTGAVRGEIVMTNQAFTNFKKHHPEAKNSRNSAAGLINAGSVSPDLTYLSIYVYTIFGYASSEALSGDIMNDESGCPEYMKYRWSMIWLMNNFTTVVPWKIDKILEVDYISKMRSLQEELSSQTDIPSDGLVLCDIIINFQKTNIPEGYKETELLVDAYEVCYQAQAYKFDSEVAVTTVTAVEWNLSRFMKMIPTVVFEPVQLAGTEVRRATGFHAQYIQENKIGVGAVVEVEKHGEIIPNINQVLEPAIDRNCVLPAICPSCGQELRRDGLHLVCCNLACEYSSMQDVIIWCKTLAPVDGLSDTLIEKFIRSYFVREISVENIMSNLESLAVICAPEGSHEYKFQKMLFKLHTDSFPIDIALKACNIPRIGDVASKKLGRHFDHVINMIAVASDDHESSDIQAVIYAMARSVLGDADSESLSENADKLKNLNYIIHRLTNMKGSEIRKVAVTGKLSVPRSKFESEIKSAGFVIKDVNKDTVCLITDNPTSTSSKNTKAIKLNIPRLSEQEFRERFLNHL